MSRNRDLTPLAIANPKLFSELHPTKNDIDLSILTNGSGKKVWWYCKKCGHEWRAAVAFRKSGGGCGVCSNNQILVGYNDLETLLPGLAQEWHPTKNSKKPSEVGAQAKYKAWWMGSCGHEWEASVASRYRGVGCHVCLNRVFLSGYNDILTVNPTLASEYLVEVNLIPVEQIPFYSANKDITWKKDVCGHIWKDSPKNRLKKIAYCPVCSNKVIIAGINDLLSTHPYLAEKFHPSNDIDPKTVSSGSEKKVLWIDSCGHEWWACVKQVSKNGGKCPYCVRGRLLTGVNDLATINPLLAGEWDLDKNILLPSEVGRHSQEEVWWKCLKEQHSFKSKVTYRTESTGCPVCINRMILPGVNDLLTTHPEFKKELLQGEYEKASNLSAGSTIKLTWQCTIDAQHIWSATPLNRILGRSGCPQCAKGGFKTEKPSKLYFIKNLVKGSYKIGIMNSHTERLVNWSKIGWEIITVVDYRDGKEALRIETEIMRWLRKDKNIPPFLSPEDMGHLSGWSETFAMDMIEEQEILEVILSKSNSKTIV